MKNVRKSFFAAPGFYVVAILLSWIAVEITFVLYAIVPLLFVFPLDKENTHLSG
jgi:hypothetical protein